MASDRPGEGKFVVRLGRGEWFGHAWLVTGDFLCCGGGVESIAMTVDAWRGESMSRSVMFSDAVRGTLSIMDEAFNEAVSAWVWHGIRGKRSNRARPRRVARVRDHCSLNRCA